MLTMVAHGQILSQRSGQGSSPSASSRLPLPPRRRSRASRPRRPRDYDVPPCPGFRSTTRSARPWLSTAAAALPIVLLLAALGLLEWRAHRAALLGLGSALAVSVFVYGMPLGTATATAAYGAAYGLLPIGWIVLNAVFLYNLTVETGQFEVVKASVGRLSSRSPHPGAAGRVFVRGVHRRGVGLRHAGRDLLRAADRARLHAALRRRVSR